VQRQIMMFSNKSAKKLPRAAGTVFDILPRTRTIPTIRNSKSHESSRCFSLLITARLEILLERARFRDLIANQELPCEPINRFFIIGERTTTTR
jgi:hypothetical protein